MNVIKALLAGATVLTPLLISEARAAVDYASIKRTIAKEPTYQGQPQYCLLVFGPEAKTRVWLVLDGEVLYVDRNGNGDLTEDGERVQGNDLTFNAGAIVQVDRKRTHQLTRLMVSRDQDKRQGIRQAFLGTAGNQGPPQRLAGFVPFADRPQDAIVVPFDQDGLTLTLLDWHGAPNYLQPGGRLAQSIPLDPSQRGVRPLSVLVGWPVPGLEGKAFVAVIEHYKQLLGEKVLPAVEIEFPASPGMKKPLRLEAVVFH